MAKGFNGNQEGKKRMKVFFSSFLNRMRRMNSTPIQPICNKEEALKRYRTVFWSVWNKESIYQLLLIHSSHRDTSSCICKPFHLFISLLYHLDSWSCHFSKWIDATLNNTIWYWMRLIVVLLFMNWFLTVINSNSFSSDYHNQESVRIRSNDISTPLLSSSIPTVIPKKQGKSPFGMKIDMIE